MKLLHKFNSITFRRQALVWRCLTLSLCLSLLPATQVNAADNPNERDYTVELLIFTQTPAAGTTEAPGKPWQPQLPQTQGKGSSAPAYIVGDASAWQQMTEQHLPRYAPVRPGFSYEARKLERSGEHRILFHEAWKMHVVGRDRSIPILFQGGDQYGSRPELQGKIQVSVGRYLHVNLDAYLTQFQKVDHEGDQLPTAHKDQAIGPQPLFRAVSSAHLQQTRRMRSNEIHYIDSPYFGAMIRIQRAE